jgi:hypothetical protein
MEPTQELVDSIYIERVRRARETDPQLKLLDGPRLFDYVCRIMLDGIRDEQPGVDDERARQVLRQRIALRVLLEQPREQ